jgi:hypothetical protein
MLLVSSAAAGAALQATGNSSIFAPSNDAGLLPAAQSFYTYET